MAKKRLIVFILLVNILFSFLIKLCFILHYKNQLTLASDDLNYIKSAVVLLHKGVFTFHNFNEPTVFVTPLFPLFLAGVFKVFGWGLTGLQAVRILQAVLSSFTVLLAFLTARELCNERIAVLTSFLVSYYIPNITTTGYLLTETLFTFLLTLLIYLSLRFLKAPEWRTCILAGVVWAMATLCRPTTAFFPLLLFFCSLMQRKLGITGALKMGSAMLLVFVVLMGPWWVRNYVEYGEFIPLAAASGNPMLQGTYIGYLQTSGNTTRYKLGRNALETDKIEVEVAKQRIREGFGKEFLPYLRWYTLGKTNHFWNCVFYWREYGGIGAMTVLKMHYVILLGLPCIAFFAVSSLIYRLFRRFSGSLFAKLSAMLEALSCRNSTGVSYGLGTYLLPVLVIVYFNVVHCVYMAFDRYAYPLLPVLSIFSAVFLQLLFFVLGKGILFSGRCLKKIWLPR